MKNYIHLLFLAVIALQFSCKKETAPLASVKADDPFMRYDSKTSNVDHQIYLVYQQTKIPVLYSDTVSKSPLVRLVIGYHLTSIDSLVTVRYLNSDADKLAGLQFIQNEIIPNLGPQLQPYSILIADSVYTYKFDYYGNRSKAPLDTYQGLNTLAIGRISEIKAMVPDSLNAFRLNIFQAILSSKLSQQPALVKAFYAVSQDYYNRDVYGDGTFGNYLVYKPEEEYGFLAPDGITPPYYYKTPVQDTDLSLYLKAMLSLSTDQFNAQYSNYPLVLSKYTILKQSLLTLGFKFP